MSTFAYKSRCIKYVESLNCRAHEHPGLSVSALYAAHVVGAGLFAMDVGHEAKVRPP